MVEGHDVYRRCIAVVHQSMVAVRTAAANNTGLLGQKRAAIGRGRIVLGRRRRVGVYAHDVLVCLLCSSTPHQSSIIIVQHDDVGRNISNKNSN